jgi:hypothetical protein
MSACENESKCQNTDFLLVDIQIWNHFYVLTWQEKETFKPGSSLAIGITWWTVRAHGS